MVDVAELVKFVAELFRSQDEDDEDEDVFRAIFLTLLILDRLLGETVGLSRLIVYGRYVGEDGAALDSAEIGLAPFNRDTGC